LIVAGLDMGRIISNRLKVFHGAGLRAKALRGSAWTVLGYGASQAIRLLSNLVLTRLLFPEAFGLMAIIQVFMQGLAMFSDMGTGPSIIQNKRGDEPAFLNTAWTLQVIRGFTLFAITVLISVPIAYMYDEPSLISLMPVAGLAAVISGFNPTKLVTANRKLFLGKLTIIEITSQIVSVGVLILLAWLMRSVWALVFGGILAQITKLVLIHRFIPGPTNRFLWDSDSLKSLVHFGKWIFLSSIVGFFVQQGDKLVLATFMTTAELGVYSIAFFLASAPWALNLKLNQLIFFPIYSQLKGLNSEQLRPKILKARLAVCGLLIPPLLILMLFGNHIVMFLYDDRYWGAGWMIQILSMGYAISVGTNIGPFYLAQGNSKLFLIIVVVKALLMGLCMILGGYLYGVTGVVFGIAASNFVFYIFSSAVYSYFNLWLWKLDILIVAIILCAAAIPLSRIIAA